MNYLELLRNPLWQKKSADIKNRDGWQCRRCSDKLTNLQVHHLYYIYGNYPWEYEDDALITLCELCHKKAEFIKWFSVKGVYQLYISGFSKSDINEIKETITRRVEANLHRQSVERYMDDLKLLCNG